MRTTRSYDPQSGITTVKDITLISTSGVTANEYNELPEKVDSSDKLVKSNQVIANALDSIYNQSETGNSGMVGVLNRIANNIPGASINADTIMVTIGEDVVSLNDAIASILQSLNTLTTKVDSLINTSDSGSESSNSTSTE